MLVLHLIPAAQSQAPDAATVPPFVIRPINADRLPQEMERVRQGVLIQLPFADFVERVQKAQAAAAAKIPPRLLESRYRAFVRDNALHGTGQWMVANPDAAPAILKLQPLNLAIRRLRFEDQDALLADFDGKVPGLLLDGIGQKTVAIEWSARGDPSPEGLLFDLRVPPCGVALLELDLPENHTVAVSPDGHLVTGPHQADDAKMRRWRIGFAGRSQLHLTVRPGPSSDRPPPVIHAIQQTTQKINPDSVDAEFQFDLKVLHQGVRVLRCECDPELRPYDVSIPNLESWEILQPDPPTGPTTSLAPLTLLIRLREPIHAGQAAMLRVLCLAPLSRQDAEPPSDKVSRLVSWNCPGVRLRDSVLRNEGLVLLIHPNVRLEDWQPGAFRLTKARTDPDGTQVLSLSSSGTESERPEASSRRPSARIQMQDAEFQIRQLAWWQVGPEKASLQVQVNCEVTHGRLFELPFSLPPGWELDRDVELSPSGLLRNWHVRQAEGRSNLAVSLRHPLAAAARGRGVEGEASAGSSLSGDSSTLQLTMQLRPSHDLRGPASYANDSAVPMAFAFPDIVPLGARRLEGALAIEYDQQLYDAALETSAIAAPPDEEGPWGRQTPDYFYPYRGRSVQGVLRLQRRNPLVRARCATEVVLASGRAALTAHLSLQPEVGSTDTVDLTFSAPITGKWSWVIGRGNNSVLGFERLQAVEAVPHLGILSAGNTLGAVVLLASPSPPGEMWRLKLARPLREPLTLHGTCELSRPIPQDRWEVPLLTVAGTSRMDGEVKLFLSGADVVQAEFDGLREVREQTPGQRGRLPSPWRTFHYNHQPVSLTMYGQVPAADRSAEVVADQASLTTYLEPSGRLLHHYRFQLWNWRRQTVPVRLPANVQLLAIRVDDNWVTRLPRASTVEDRLVVELPVPLPDRTTLTDARAGQVYELLYSEDGGGWTFWNRIKVDLPGLPVSTLSTRHIWRLPPGVVPLLDSGQRRLPGLDSSRPWERNGFWEQLPRARFLDLLTADKPYISEEDPKSIQRRQMDAAALALARGPIGTLGELIDRLTFEHLKEKGPLVLDATTLATLGLSPSTLLSSLTTTELADTRNDAPPWENLGLVYVPCRAAPLLTSRRQVESWLVVGQGTVVPLSIQEAVAEATVDGRDPSGRFWTAADWLRRRPDAFRGDGFPSAFSSLQTEFPWTDWEPIAGNANDSILLVVRQDVMPGIGVTLAAFLCLAFWLAGPLASRRHWEFLLIWLTVAGLAFIWLPGSLQALAWWPLVAGGAIALFWHLAAANKSRIHSRSAKQSARRSVAVASVLVWIGIAGFAGNAAAPPQNPAVPVVFLLPGDADAPGKQMVLAQPELLQQLETLAHSRSSGAREPVLVSAVYEGKVVSGTTEFNAAFAVYCPLDEPVELMLPLDGVQLQDEVMVDGGPALPETAKPPLTGYVVKLKTRGTHAIRMRFRVPVQTQGDDCTVRFTAPGLAQNRLAFDAPAGVRYLQAFVGPGAARGAQHVSTINGGRQRLEADLGRLSPPLHQLSVVQLRWRQDSSPPRSALVQAQEAYLWNLRADSSILTAVLRYTVREAPISGLAIVVPEGLEVQGVESAAPAGNSVRLKDWHVESDNDRRRLQLEFNGPVLGELTITAQLVPVRPFGAIADLKLPVPLARPSPEPSLLAFRMEGLHAEVSGNKYITYLDRLRFAEEWQKAGRNDPMPPTSAFFFRRRADETPELRLHLSRPPVLVDAVQDVNWRVSQRQAEFHATARLTAPNDDLAFVEWEAPGVETVTSVSGPDLHSWSRSGSRIQVWLRRSVSATEIHMDGWLPLDSGRGKPADFRLPALRFIAAQNQHSFVRIQPGADSALSATVLDDLKPLPDPRASDQDLSYMAPHADYAATFQVRPAMAVVDARVLTLAEVRERQLAFVTHIDYQVRKGELRRAAVRLRNWPGDARLEGNEVGLGNVQTRGTGDDRLWIVTLRGSVTSRYRLTLSGNIPLDKAAAGVPMPDVSVPRAERLDRWLSLSGRDLSVETTQGLVPVSELERELQSWPAEADRLRRSGGGQVWRIEPGVWNPRLLPRPREANHGPIRVFLAEQKAAVVDGRRWGHEVVYWLYHDANTDLTTNMPEGARVVGVAIDDVPVTPLQLSPRHLWLPLPGAAGIRSVRIRWSYEGGSEQLEQPLLARPRLEGATEGPLLWTVQVPAEYRAALAPGSAIETAPIGGAGMDVRRAEAFLGLSAALAERSRDDGADRQQLASIQRRFYDCCRFAAHELAVSAALLEALPSRLDPTDRLQELHGSNQELALRLQALLKQNLELAEKSGFEDIRARAERLARTGRPLAEPLPASITSTISPVSTGAGLDRTTRLSGGGLPEHGMSLRLQGEAESAYPQLILTPIHTSQLKSALAGSLLLLSFLVLSWGLSRYPVALSWARAFWPEQVALLGCLGWQVIGPNLAVVFLILLGICARLITLAQATVELLRRWKPAAEAVGETGSST